VNRTTLAYALLFALPVGVGVSMAVGRTFGAGAFTPVVVVPGVSAALFLFTFVVVVGRRGEPDPSRTS